MNSLNPGLTSSKTSSVQQAAQAQGTNAPTGANTSGLTANSKPTATSAQNSSSTAFAAMDDSTSKKSGVKNKAPAGGKSSALAEQPAKKKAKLSISTPGKTPGKAKATNSKASQSNVRRSGRVAKHKADNLKKLIGDHKPNPKLKNDMTQFVKMPLQLGTKTLANGGSAVDEKITGAMRTEINSAIDKTKTTHSSLQAAVDAEELPQAALNMKMKIEAEGGKNYAHESTRSDTTGFKDGLDVSFTLTTEIVKDKRTSADTPEPRSPRPQGQSTMQGKDHQYERAHQTDFGRTGDPGTTIWAPKVANQVIDTHLEGFATPSKKQPLEEAFTYREDTFTTSTLYAGRKLPGSDEWELKSASYERRQDPDTTSTGASGTTDNTTAMDIDSTSDSASKPAATSSLKPAPKGTS